jgi:hypothetical protein
MLLQQEGVVVRALAVVEHLGDADSVDRAVKRFHPHE